IGGFKTRLQLYTIPGQVFYNTTRKLVLKGVDGIVFVADSQKAMLDANLESFKNLRENLAEIGLSIDEIPLVLQLNKRDLPNIAPIAGYNPPPEAEPEPVEEIPAEAFIRPEPEPVPPPPEPPPPDVPTPKPPPPAPPPPPPEPEIDFGQTEKQARAAPDVKH